MSRSQRLLHLLQLLRRRRHPVAGAVLARELEVSLRTLYRDIAALQAQGACIDGEPGIGYLLRPGFALPPLMFSENEIQAISLGARWVAESADRALRIAAEDVLAKIAAVVPDLLRHGLYDSPLLVGPGTTPEAEKELLGALRKAIESEVKLSLRYTDGAGRATRRTVWPFGLGFFEEVRVLAAWCETRGDFRHFRTDRIDGATPLAERYPPSRQSLLADWRRSMDGWDAQPEGKTRGRPAPVAGKGKKGAPPKKESS